MPINDRSKLAEDRAANILSQFDSEVRAKYFDISGIDQLFHYTNANAITAIVPSKILHLSNIRFMNDKQEVEYSLSVLSDVLEEEATAGWIARGSDAYASIAEELPARLRDRAGRQFVLSLSCDPDALHLWTAYSGEDGYSLGFRLVDLAEAFSKHRFAFVNNDGTVSEWRYSMFHGKVLYDPSPQRDAVRAAIHLYAELVNLEQERLFDPGPSPISMARIRLGFYLDTLLYSLKFHPHYVESEYRIAIMPDSGFEAVRYSNRGGLIVPYVRLRNDAFPLKTLGIGPKQNDTAAAIGAREILDVNGFRSVELLPSRIGLR